MTLRFLYFKTFLKSQCWEMGDEPKEMVLVHELLGDWHEAGLSHACWYICVYRPARASLDLNLGWL
jgi:hypothetical protein